MSKILLLGAGRSVNSLVYYLKKHALTLDLALRVGDINSKSAKKVASIIPQSTYFQFDVTSDKPLDQETRNADVVISMLPSHLHGKVALSCINTNTHLITASYTNAQINNLHKEAKKKNLLFLMECGLDPGIDHMSAMKSLDSIKEKGGKIQLFKSFTGGLLAPKSDNNPWHYKFTWNPRNVVLAGQGVVKFKRNNHLKYIPYSSLFKRLETVTIPEAGVFEAYANRDSLKYLSYYGIEDCPTVFRGTLRRPGFCQAWDFLVTLGLTNDTLILPNTYGMTYRAFLNSFLVSHPTSSVEQKIEDLIDKSNRESIFEKIESIGLFSDQKIKLKEASPAQVLQHILEQKWVLDKEDKDMVVMQHLIEYTIKKETHTEKSSLVLYGDDNKNTSMAKSVGLPLGIATRLLLQNKLNIRGVITPVHKEIYTPILNELEGLGIVFKKG